MQVQELVGIVPWNFIATICNLFIQVYLIKRFLFKPINEMLEKRKAKADAQIQDAVKAKEEAQAMKAEYEKKDVYKRQLVDWLKKDGRTNSSAVVEGGTSGAKKAILSYEVLETWKNKEEDVYKRQVMYRMVTLFL